MNIEPTAGWITIGGSWGSSFGPARLNYKAFMCYDLLDGGKQTLSEYGVWTVDNFTLGAKGLGETHLNLSIKRIGGVYKSGAPLPYDGTPKQVTIRVVVSFVSTDQAYTTTKSEVGNSSSEDITSRPRRFGTRNSRRRKPRSTFPTPENVTEMLYSSRYRSTLTPNNAAGETQGLFAGTPLSYFDSLYCSWDTLQSGSIVALLVHPGYEIIQRLLTSSPLQTGILMDLVEGLAGFEQGFVDEEPCFASTIRHVLRIALRVLEIQDIFLDVLLPLLHEFDSALLIGIGSCRCMLASESGVDIILAQTVVDQATGAGAADGSDSDADPAVLQQAIRLVALQLFFKNTEVGRPYPNMTHFLFFGDTKSEEVIQDPRALGARRACIHVIFDLANIGVPWLDTREADRGDPFFMTLPGLAELLYRIIYQLCTHSRASEFTMRYLRTREDCFARQLAALPSQLHLHNIEFVQSLAFDWAESLTVEPVELHFLSQLNPHSCVRKDGTGCKIIDWSALLSLLSVARRTLHAHGVNPAQEEQPNKKTTYILESCAVENHRWEVAHARSTGYESWERVLDMTLTKCSSRLPHDYRGNMFFDLLHVLPTILRSEDIQESPAVLLSVAVLSSVTKLREDRRHQILVQAPWSALPSRDAIDGSEVWKTVALMLLDFLFQLPRLEKQHVVLPALSVLKSDPDDLNPLYVYEAKMSLLVRMAQTQSGAERLLEAQFIPILSQRDYLDARPEADQSFIGKVDTNQDSSLPSAIHRYHQLSMPALQLVDGMLATLGTKHATSSNQRHIILLINKTEQTALALADKMHLPLIIISGIPTVSVITVYGHGFTVAVAVPVVIDFLPTNFHAYRDSNAPPSTHLCPQITDRSPFHAAHAAHARTHEFTSTTRSLLPHAHHVRDPTPPSLAYFFTAPRRTGVDREQEQRRRSHRPSPSRAPDHCDARSPAPCTGYGLAGSTHTVPHLVSAPATPRIATSAAPGPAEQQLNHPLRGTVAAASRSSASAPGPKPTAARAKTRPPQPPCRVRSALSRIRESVCGRGFGS
ncbi:hypothetical protein B0H15DRAFT_994091 [Mycena belliarum]|uniref:Uncharacterized protein n=1 Tax=Mycena belliarum TaxID=1033014 RepID=A0AAD6U006_9AGAR|nr:hypothetical protein B0H15DRAFT_994091 [Mycena belliae]